MTKCNDPPGCGDFEVGYGKPPTKSRFKKGQSGNPKGRPKKSRNLKTLLEDALNEVITVQQGDTVRRLTKKEVAIQAMITKAMKADSKAFIALFGATLKANETDDIGEAASSPTSAADEEILADYVRRNGATPVSGPRDGT